MSRKIPLLNQLREKVKAVYNDLGGGVNNGLPPIDLNPNVATEMKNMNSYDAPALSPRKKRFYKTYGFSGDMHSLFNRKDNILCHIEDNKWGYLNLDNDTTGTVMTLSSSGPASAVDFMNKTLVVNGTDKVYWDGSAHGTISSDMPASHFLAVHANRVYAANKDNQTLAFSALRKYNDWKTIKDAGSITIETKDGQGCTGLASYANHIVYFKKNSIHELYGTSPLNYVMKTLTDDIGCVSHRSIQEVQGRLYFLSIDGIRAYSGGTVPNNTISFPIQKYIDQLDPDKFDQCVAGTDQERYFINLQLKGNKTILCVYDARFQRWFVEDEFLFTDFTYINNTLYGLDNGSYMDNGTASKSIVDMSSDDGLEEVDWYWISKAYQDSTISGKKTYYRFYLTAKMEANSEFSLYASTDFEGDTFTKIKTITTGQGITKQKIMIPTNLVYDADVVRFKIEGKGHVEFYNFERQLRIRQDIY